MNWKRNSGIAILLVLLVCAQACLQTPPPAGTISAGRRECPHTVPREVVAEIGGEVADLNVPEYNDCQRFIRAGSGGEAEYGELFAIYAGAFDPDSLPYYEDNLPQGTQLVAYSAAVVEAHGVYDPLGINDPVGIDAEAKFFCLIVWRDPPLTGLWKARMVPRNLMPNGSCKGIIDPGSITAGTELDVIRRQASGLTATGDYPRAARWDWDRNKQIAGITCDRAWCNVGSNLQRPPSFHERHPPSPPPGSKAWQRVTDVKGWHDEQYLAVIQDVPTDRPPVSGILGTIIPDTLLGRRTIDHFQGKWVEAAQVALEHGSTSQIDAYTQKFGFTRAVPPGRLNKIFACFGNCLPSGAIITGECHCPPNEPNCNDDDWFARVEGADKSGPVYHQLCRYELTGSATPPATARWRWLAGDEGTWFRCVDGCCELTGEGEVTGEGEE